MSGEGITPVIWSAERKAAHYAVNFCKELSAAVRDRGKCSPEASCPFVRQLPCSCAITGLATRLPIAVLDLDSSDLSGSIIRTVDATPDAAVAMRVCELAEGGQLIRSGQVH